MHCFCKFVASVKVNIIKHRKLTKLVDGTPNEMSRSQNHSAHVLYLYRVCKSRQKEKAL